MHMREHYREQLATLYHELEQMGQQTVAQVARAVEALHQHDPAAAAQIVSDDALLDQQHEALRTRVVDIMATQQPVARDLRLLIAVLDISSELERIGDYAKSIAKVALREEATARPAPAMLPQLAREATALLTSMLQAVAKRDAEMARRFAAMDDQVDGLRTQVRDELIASVEHDPSAAKWAFERYQVSHVLERIADRSTNIAERLVFMMRGEMVELND